MNPPDKDRLSSENGWKEYKVYLLNSIEVITDELKTARKDRTELKIALASIEKDILTQSKMWGALSGVGSAILVAVFIKGFGL